MHSENINVGKSWKWTRSSQLNRLPEKPPDNLLNECVLHFWAIYIFRSADGLHADSSTGHIRWSIALDVCSIFVKFDFYLAGWQWLIMESRSHTAGFRCVFFWANTYICRLPGLIALYVCASAYAWVCGSANCPMATENTKQAENKEFVNQRRLKQHSPRVIMTLLRN